MEHCPEAWHIPPGTPCISVCACVRACVCVCASARARACYILKQAYDASSEVSRSYTITHTHSVCLLQMSDQPVAETITYATHNKYKR